jgi:hypothetical protein
VRGRATADLVAGTGDGEPSGGHGRGRWRTWSAGAKADEDPGYNIVK